MTKLEILLIISIVTFTRLEELDMWNWHGLLDEGRWVIPWILINGLGLGVLVYVITYG